MPLVYIFKISDCNSVVSERETQFWGYFLGTQRFKTGTVDYSLAIICKNLVG